MPRHLPAKTEKTPAWAIELSERERRFVIEYCVDLNGKNAAIRAGLGKTPKSATEIASRMRKKASVATAIAQLIAERSDTTSTAILTEFARIAFAKFSDYARVENGQLVIADTASLTEDQLAAISEISETVNENGRTIRIKLHDKLSALDKLAKVLSLYRDRLELSGPNGGPMQFEEVDPMDRINARLDQLAKARATAADVFPEILPPRARQIAPYAPPARAKVIDAE